MKIIPHIFLITLLIIKIFGQDTNDSLNNEMTEENFTEDTTMTSSQIERIKNVGQEEEISKNGEILGESITESSTRSSKEETVTNRVELIENNKVSDRSEAVTDKRTIEMDAVKFEATVIETKKLESANNISIENTTEIVELNTTEQVTTETFVDLGTMEETTSPRKEVIKNQTVSDGMRQVVDSNTVDETKQITFNDSTALVVVQEEIKEISLKSDEVLSETFTTTAKTVLTSKPSTTLEDYAVKQMNFILDHLLLEIQKFVATVLQATVYTVFQRDYLKRYAESLNHILSSDNESDYSDEVIEDAKTLTQVELYEEILLKLNFLKSKSSKNLPRHLPPDWLSEYRSKRAELVIWIDKAAEEMHQAFRRYVKEEDDRFKHQYFNEAFDDILRATEIRHKLALLADLVKIVKNKRQITFLDLYMQT